MKIVQDMFLVSDDEKELIEIVDNNLFGKITIPDGIERIGSHAFYNRTQLRDVKFPNSLKEIGDRAFYSCTRLTEIVLPDSVVKLGNCSFCNCIELVSIHLSEGLIEVPLHCFSRCNLQSIVIPEKITKIGFHAFAWNENLKDISLPRSLKDIGPLAFKYSPKARFCYAGNATEFQKIHKGAGWNWKVTDTTIYYQH